MSDQAERFILSIVPDDLQDMLHLLCRLRMHVLSSVMVHEVVQGIRALVVLTMVGLTGCHTVADAFDQIIVWHGNRRPYPVQRVIPVFPVVLVMALVVQPPLGIAMQFLLIDIWRTPALVVLHTRNELAGGILGKIMRQSLPVQPAGKAMLSDKGAVMVDGTDMSGEPLPESRLSFFF